MHLDWLERHLSCLICVVCSFTKYKHKAHGSLESSQTCGENQESIAFTLELTLELLQNFA